MSRRLTNEEFEKRARGIHGNKYSYGRVIYKSYHEKVEIVCPKHGSFWQLPGNHLRDNGTGCPECAKEKTWNKRRESQKKLIDTHPDLCKELKDPEIAHKYTYGSHKKPWWVCSICSYEWETTIKNRTRKDKATGCPECYRRNTSELIRSISNSGKYTIDVTHPDLCKELKDSNDASKYTYGSDKKVGWVCKVCGYEWESTISHRTISKRGCPNCANNIKHTRERFIKTSNKIHDNLYNYEKVIYVNNNTKVEIICKEDDHGSFFVSPSNHIHHKSGCPQCAAVRGLVGKTEQLLLNKLLEILPEHIKITQQKQIGLYYVDFSILNKDNTHELLIEFDEYGHYINLENPESNYHRPIQMSRQSSIITPNRSLLRIPDIYYDVSSLTTLLSEFIIDFYENSYDQFIVNPEDIWSDDFDLENHLNFIKNSYQIS